MSYDKSLPVTKEDKKLSKQHLKQTKKLVKQKIKDHKKLVKSGAGDKSYNVAHIVHHEKEYDDIVKQMRKVIKVKGK
jgi:hypothetical protein